MDLDDKKPVKLVNTRSDDFGRVATRLLFRQYNPAGKEDINEWRERFVSTLDPTEYAGAVALLGSWPEWERFKRNWPSFQRRHLDEWLDEIDLRLKSLAIRSLVKEAQGLKGAAAAKFLAEGKYKERKAGRPTKAEITRQLKQDTRLEQEIADDLERIGVHANTDNRE